VSSSGTNSSGPLAPRGNLPGLQLHATLRFWAAPPRLASPSPATGASSWKCLVRSAIRPGADGVGGS